MRPARLREDLIDPAINRAKTDLRTLTVGLVDQFRRSGVRARVRALIQTVTVNGSIVDDNPSPAAVVHTPRGDGYGVFFDCAPGDPGLLIASDRPWAGSWKTGDASLPEHAGSHDYSSAAFLPGGHVGDGPPANPAGQMLVGAEDRTAAVLLHRRAGRVTVEASGPASSVRLGGDGGATLAYQAETKAVLADIVTWIAAIQVALVDPNIIPIDPLAIALKSIGASQAPTVASLGANLAAHIGTIKTEAQ